MPNIKEQKSKRRALNKKLCRLELSIKNEREKLINYFKKRLGKREPWLVDFELGNSEVTFCSQPLETGTDGQEVCVQVLDALLCHPDPVTKESRILFGLLDHFKGDVGETLVFCEGATIRADVNVTSQTKVILT